MLEMVQYTKANYSTSANHWQMLQALVAIWIPEMKNSPGCLRFYTLKYSVLSPGAAFSAG